ncbi:hypothetical protein HW49_07405 [Porphyromonadaceae bacterium COT-184 OH4590]|nr:hypothetical protein HW49_07405 [Porphyromonadaceae bacterium COT-184 OH4590]
MKKLGLILLTAAVMVACGNKAKEAEQARLDSIARADSIAKVEAMIADSLAAIQQAEAAAEQARLDSIAKADSIAAVKSGKPIPKRAVAKPAEKPVTKPSIKALEATREKDIKSESLKNTQLNTESPSVKKEEPKAPQTPAEAAAAVEKAKKEAIQKAQTPAEAAAAAERAKKEAISK